MQFKNEKAALEVLKDWQNIMEELSFLSGISYVDCFILRKLKIFSCRGKILKPKLLGSKLVLDLTFSAIFWRGHWDMVCEVLGDLVPEVSHSRGMPSNCFILSSELSAMEVKLEMWSEVLKFDGFKPFYSKNLKKTLR